MRKLDSLSWFLSVLALAGVVHLWTAVPPTADHRPPTETAYERVLRTQTLRCGYGTWHPGVYKDPTSGEMKGLFVELINQMGKLSNLKIEWTAEVDWGQITQALQSGKIDAFCAGMANDAARGKQLAYSRPLSFWTFDVMVRADDTRFSGDSVTVGELNKPTYATAYTEGDVLETIAKSDFPKVKGIPLPPLGTPADNVMNVLSKKTDFVVMPKVMFQAFEAANPGKLRYLRVTPPLRAFGNVIAVGMEDLRLQQLVNASVEELTSSGTYIQILQKYDQAYPGAFIPVKAAP
ncbi:MAG: substrate-binding periplasmic protein [Bdellovibrionales bacterium]